MSASEPDVVTENELVELFRRRRPDAAAFRARLAARVAEREAGQARGEDEGDGGPRGVRAILRQEFLRRAAAFLPLDPTGAGAAKLVVSGVALPFLVLVASVGAFVEFGRSILHVTRTAQPAGSEPRWYPVRRGIVHPDVPRHLRAGAYIAAAVQPLGMVVVLLGSLLGSRVVTEILVALFLVAALALALTVRQLGEVAQLTPTTAARSALGILSGLLCGLFLFPQGSVSAHGSDLGPAWPAAVLVVGTLILGVQGLGKGVVRRGAWIAFLLALVVINPFGLTLHGPVDLRREVERAEISQDLSGWEDLGNATAALHAVGADMPSSDAALGVIDRALADGTDLHPQVWTSALHAGWMTTERWRQLAARPSEARALDRLLDARAPVNTTSYYEYQAAMLVATRDLTPARRENLADRVEAQWPQTGDHGALERALVCVRWLERLGLADRVDARRSAVHALLVDHWWPGELWSPFRRPGGFTPNPNEFHTSMADDTHAAVVLMARFGVPEPIDVRAVRSYLRGESAAFYLLLPQPAWLKMTARAALLRLEREVGIPPRSPLAAVVGERLCLASVLLVVLCLLAVASAPRPSGSTSRAALP
jgi:hypothetical protein